MDSQTLSDSAPKRTRIESLPAEELTRFLGQLGHEIGTPLGSIRMLSELLADALEAPDRLRHTRRLQEAAGEIRDLVQAVLRLVRLRTGWLSPEASEFDGVAFGASLAGTEAAIVLAVADDLPKGLRLDADFLRDAVRLCCQWAAEQAEGAKLDIRPGPASGLYHELRCPGRPLPWHEPALLDPIEAGDLVLARRHSVPGLPLPLAAMLTWRLGGRLQGRFDLTSGENVLELTVPAELADPLADAV